MGCAVNLVMFLLPACFDLFLLVASPVEASRDQFRYDVSVSSKLNGGATNHGINSSVHQLYRTGFHFQPKRNWMNDPNGPLFYKGYYHLFYQYNPDAAVWGNIVWGHAVSKDLIQWRYLQTALKGDHWYDIQGVWSGSATFLKDGTPALMYTGWSNESQQIQNLALPQDTSDPLLREWMKAPSNPVAVAPKGYNGSEFRDPTTAWLGKDGFWRMLVGANRGVGGNVGTALMYKSNDFVTWEYSETPLHSVERTGMWECPDFYPVHVSNKRGLETSAHGLDVKHVLKVSLDDKKHDYYSVGTYNLSTDTYEPENAELDTGIGLRYDYGKFYASKTFFDQSKDRRILWGWANESSSMEEDIEKGWSSVQCVPRHIWLDSITNTNLIQWPIEEVEKLRRNQITKKNLILEAGSVMHLDGVKGVQLDIEVHFGMPNKSSGEDATGLLAETGQLACSQSGSGHRGHFGPFGVLVLATEDMEEHTAVFFHMVHDSSKESWRTLVCSDQSRSSIAKDLDRTAYGSYVHVHETDSALSLRILVDHSIVESFVQGGRAVMTSRVYPVLATGESSRVFLFNNGTQDVLLLSVTVWDMKSANLRDISSSEILH